MKLLVKNISNSDDFDTYLNDVFSFEVINPFYAVFGTALNDELFESLHYFTFLEESGKILILMPFILRKVPYQVDKTSYYDVVSPYGYSGPLYNESLSRGYLIYFWKHVDAWYKKNNVVSEFIRFSLNHNHQFYNGMLVPTLSNVKGKVRDPEQQWALFKPKVRNNYRKSKEAGLEAKFYTHDDIDSQALQYFYDIYIHTMHRICADVDYFYSLNYFNNLLKLSKTNFILVLVSKDDSPISGELILIAGDTLYSYLGGTLIDYFQYRPNDFLKLEVMTWAYHHSYKYYLLGGGRKEGDSLYQYKKSFFSNDEDIIYYTGRKIVNKEMYQRLDTIMNSEVIDSTKTKSKEKIEKNNFFPTYRKPSAAYKEYQTNL